jgi:hypothetical protein
MIKKLPNLQEYIGCTNGNFYGENNVPESMLCFIKPNMFNYSILWGKGINEIRVGYHPKLVRKPAERQYMIITI